MYDKQFDMDVPSQLVYLSTHFQVTAHSSQLYLLKNNSLHIEVYGSVHFNTGAVYFSVH